MALKGELMASSLPAAAANKLGFDAQATVSAAGTTQGTATTLVSNFSNVTTAAANSGVIIGRANEINVVINNGANPVKVYPPSGHAINGGSANAAFTVTNGKAAIFYPAGTNWCANMSA